MNALLQNGKVLLLFSLLTFVSGKLLGQPDGNGSQANGGVELQPQSAYWSRISAEETYCSELYRLLKDKTRSDPVLLVSRFPEIYSGVHFMEPLKEALKKLGLDDQLCPPASPMVSRGVPFYFRPFKLSKKAEHEKSVGGGDEFSHLYVLTDGDDKVVGIHLVCLAPKGRHKPNTDFFYFDFPLSKKRSSTITRVRWEVEDAGENLILKAWHVHIRDGDRCLEFSRWYLPKRLANFIRYVLEVKLGVVERATALTKRESDMVSVPGGTFPDSNRYLGGAEVKNFTISRYETTWREWQEVRFWAAKNGYDIEMGDGSDDNHPVHSVLRFDVVKWCNAKSEQEGLQPVYYLGNKVFKTGGFGAGGPDSVTVDTNANGYRLPTETEWEWVRRGGVTGSGYASTGSAEALGDVAWWRENSGGAKRALAANRGTWPVGQKKPSELGVYDVCGNVWEMCYRAKKDSPAFVARGGGFNAARGVEYSFCNPPESEDWKANDQPILGVGFRLARSESR